MYENISMREKTEDQLNQPQPARMKLRAAQTLFKHDPTRLFAELNDLFRNGKIPEPMLNGRYAGELVAIEIAPGLTQFFQWLLSRWLPWLGKTFDAAHHSGDNIFTKDSYPLARVFNPFYRGFVNDRPDTYRCFNFRTYVAPGLIDTDRQVLKIDYNLKENPSLTVRRVLDELVQVDDNLYLGKAHVRWWFGGWQTVAYFTLTQR